MDKREIAVLACRIMSIFTFARIGPHVGIIASYLPFHASQGGIGQRELVVMFVQLMPILMLLALSICLWIFAEQIAFFMTAKMKPVEKSIPIDSRSVLGLAVAIGGLILLMEALSNFNGYTVYLVFVVREPNITPDQQIKWTTDFASSILKMVVGCFMLIKPYAIVDYLQRKHQMPFFPNVDGE